MLNFFVNETIKAEIRRSTVTNVSGVKTTSWEIVASVDSLFYEGATAENYVSQRFKDTTQAVILVDPATDIQKDDKATLRGVDYHVIGIDDVGAAEEVMIVPLGVFS